MKEEKLIDENQLAELTGLAVRTLQAWRYRGDGPPYMKLGSAVRYRLSDVEEWLEKNTFHSTTEASVAKQSR